MYDVKQSRAKKTKEKRIKAHLKLDSYPIRAIIQLRDGETNNERGLQNLRNPCTGCVRC